MRRPLRGGERAAAGLGAGSAAAQLEAVGDSDGEILGQDRHGAAGVGEVDMAEQADLPGATGSRVVGSSMRYAVQCGRDLRRGAWRPATRSASELS